MGSEPSRSSTLQTIITLRDTAVLGITILVIATPLLSGLGVLMWQMYSLAQSGEWSSVSVIDALVWLGLDIPWLHSPVSWIGIWKLLNWLPAALGSFLLSVVLACTMQSDT